MLTRLKKFGPGVAITVALLQGFLAFINADRAGGTANEAKASTTKTQTAVTETQDNSGAGYSVLVKEVESLYRQIERLEDRLARMERSRVGSYSHTTRPNAGSGSAAPVVIEDSQVRITPKLPQTQQAAKAYLEKPGHELAAPP